MEEISDDGLIDYDKVPEHSFESAAADHLQIGPHRIQRNVHMYIDCGVHSFDVKILDFGTAVFPSQRAPVESGRLFRPGDIGCMIRQRALRVECISGGSGHLIGRVSVMQAPDTSRVICEPDGNLVYMVE